MMMVGIGSRAWCLAHLPENQTPERIVEQSGALSDLPEWLEKAGEKSNWSDEVVGQYRVEFSRVVEIFKEHASEVELHNFLEGIVHPGDFSTADFEVFHGIKALGDLIVHPRQSAHIRITDSSIAGHLSIRPLGTTAAEITSLVVQGGEIGGKLIIDNLRVNDEFRISSGVIGSVLVSSAEFPAGSQPREISLKSLETSSVDLSNIYCGTGVNIEISAHGDCRLIIRESKAPAIKASINNLSYLRCTDVVTRRLEVVQQDPANPERRTEVEFSNIYTQDTFILDGLKFSATSAFDNLTLNGTVNWYGCTYHPVNRFTKVQFPRSSPSSIGTYRGFRLQAESYRDRLQEALFFTLEKRSERADWKVYSFDYLTSLFYDATSDYGKSIAKPLGIFLLVNVVVYFLYCGVYIQQSYPSSELAVAYSRMDASWLLDGLTFTVLQIIRPFEILSSTYEASLMRLVRIRSLTGTELFALNLVSADRGTLLTFVVAQVVLSYALLAEAAISIRWRFRRG